VGSSSDPVVDLNVSSEDASVIRSSILDAFQEAGDVDPKTADPSLRTKVCPTVKVPGKGLVYKARLISELNAGPEHLSLDRLKRVQVRMQ
jgi:hypothetical protein